MIIDPIKINETMQFLQSRTPLRPEIGVVLGSGLGAVSDRLEEKVAFPYAEIPHFPVSSVPGHPGELALGRLAGKNVIVQVGRVHFYEGLGAEKVMYPLWLMKSLGVKTVINTNSAGGINPGFSAGDLMLVVDHINFMFVNPLVGPNDEKVGPRFPDMSCPYDKQLRKKALQAAQKIGVKLHQGVLIAFLGPSYETLAELNMASELGADAVGMSSVPECIVSNYLKMRFLGLTCISNLVGPVRDKPLSHDEVMAAAGLAAKNLGNLIIEILNIL